MPSYSFLAAATIALISGANGHMLLKTPAPYGAASLNNGPLEENGSDFPCKQRAGVYDAPATKNVMPIGVPQTLSFTGSAVHGGGSCQVSLTKDLKPTKDSKWMVIHSIEGGCPAATAGNLPENSNGDGAGKFQYKIPDGINAGEYTLAWTWFNKVGNREMYMNCAPITVTGGKGKRDEEDTQYYNATEEFGSEDLFKRQATFPDMFVANIGDHCKVPEGTDVMFPNPGASVEKKGTDPKALKKPEGCGESKAPSGGSGTTPAAPAPASAGSGSGSASAPAGAASPAVSIVAIPPTGTSGGSMASAAVSVASAAQSVASAAASVVSGAGASAPATPTDSASSGSGSSDKGSGSPAPSAGSSGSGAGAPSGSASAGATSGGMPCSSPGTTMCSPDGKQFGTCDTNKMAVMMPVAQGTKCVGGAIQMGKRSAKFSKFYNKV
ncbi:MAG: hypothetical protein Q9174_002732 [Haloplaca sp. 1 TL-2023]